MARTSRRGRLATPKPKGKADDRRGGLLYGLPAWVKQHAESARRGAKTPLDTVKRWGGMLDGVLGEYLKTVEDDNALQGGANWESLARVVTPLAEARRKMAATEAELTPRGGDGAHITHDLSTREDGKPDGGPGMWRGNADVTIATVTGDDVEDD